MKKRWSDIAGYTKGTQKYTQVTAESDWKGAAGPAAQTAAGGDGVDRADISLEKSNCSHS